MMRWAPLAALAALGLARKLDYHESPLAKVVHLLEGMEADLSKEAAEDEATNEEMKRWCKTSEENQTSLITDSTSLIETQTVVVKESTAMGERLTWELRNLAKEIAAHEATLEKADVLRRDQREKFAEDSKSLKENIDAVAQALAAVNGSSFLQSPESPAVTRLKEVVMKHYDMIKTKSSRADRMLLDDFLKDPGHFTKGLGFLQKAQVGGPAETVAGMLQAMVDDFQIDLKEEQDEDGKLEKSYQALVTAKSQEVSAGQEQVTLKEQQKADAKQRVITGKEDISGATTAKAEAEKFLATARAKCAQSAESFAQRSARRTEELTAVTKAREVLTGEEAKMLEAKSKAKATSFLQLSSRTFSSPAAEKLLVAGHTLGKEELVVLGLKLKAGSLDKVKEAIEGMLRALKQEQKDEVTKNSACTQDFEENAAVTEQKQQQNEITQGKIREWKDEAQTVEEEIGKLKKEVEDLQEQLQAAQKTRAKEMSDFADMAADERLTQKLLGQAQEILAEVYKGVSLAQAGSEVPSDAVMEMLEQVQKNSVRLEEEAQEGDEESRKSFEKLAEEMKAEIKSATKDIGKKSIVKATLEGDVAEAMRKMGLTEEELVTLAATKSALHASCDFVVKNFETRQKARGAEIQALEEAKTIL